MLPKRIMRVLCGGVGIASILFLVLFSQYLIIARPHEVQSARGFVYPMPAHGGPVFLSGLDIGILILLPLTAFIFGGVLYRYYNEI